MGRIALIVAVAAVLPSAAQAVMVYGDPAAAAATHRLTSAPTGGLTDSGWQYIGTFGTDNSRYIGTPIAPNQFITAAHVGVTSSITYGGNTYTVASSTQVGTTDLRIFTINGTFSSYAPLYDERVDGSLTGKQLVVYGRGVAPGTAVTSVQPGVNNPSTVSNGWTWGAIDGTVSWGTNNVDGLSILNGGTALGQMLTFSASTSSATEAALTDKDSGGPVFVQGTGGVWKLAGVNYGVTPQSFFTVTPSQVATTNAAWYDPQGPNPAGYYYVNVTATGTAAVWDTSNLFLLYGTGGGLSYYRPASEFTVNGLQQSYSTSISSNFDAIRAIAPIPEPTSLAVLGTAGLLFCRRGRRDLAR